MIFLPKESRHVLPFERKAAIAFLTKGSLSPWKNPMMSYLLKESDYVFPSKWNQPCLSFWKKANMTYLLKESDNVFPSESKQSWLCLERKWSYLSFLKGSEYDFPSERKRSYLTTAYLLNLRDHVIPQIPFLHVIYYDAWGFMMTSFKS